MLDKISEDLKAELSSILKEIETEQKTAREAQVRFWKQLELYWKHIQDIYWDRSVKDWRHINDQGEEETIDTYYVDKIVNIYRAHGESIIAAASQDIPQCVFSPEDADNEDDVSTAKNWTLASELINKHNHADILTIRALYILYNSGIMGAYVYPKPHERNGTYQAPEYGRANLYTDFHSCAVCGADLGSNQREEEIADTQPMTCQNCGNTTVPVTDTTTEQVSKIIGYVQRPKARPCIELYSGLNIMVPAHVRLQEECGFLVLYTEADEAFSQEIAGEDFEEEDGTFQVTGTTDTGEYDRWARTETGWMNETETSLVTWRRCWFRPWMYNRVKDITNRKWLRKNAPRGLYFLMMNDIFIEASHESMDDCWVLSESPVSSLIHAEPMGAALKPIQDIYSEIVTFQLQSLEYSIPDTFADPAVVDFESYGESRAAHGTVYPIKAMPSGGIGLDNAFTTLKTSNYARESEEFKKSVSQDGQFVIGSFPSIYGGPAQGGSKTYAEYAASRSQALQRLSILWKQFSFFWAKTMEISVKIFIENMKEDEKFTQKQGDRFINIWIRKSEMAGNIGRVESETANVFPMSWAQKHDALIKLLEYKNPAIEAVITHPENTSTVAKYLGFSELYIPGEDDRNKQLEEIDRILAGDFVEIDIELDNHAIEYETVTAWCKSEHGRDTRIRMPEQYLMVKNHGAEHKQIMDQQNAAQAMMGQPQPQ